MRINSRLIRCKIAEINAIWNFGIRLEFSNLKKFTLGVILIAKIKNRLKIAKVGKTVNSFSDLKMV